MVRNLKALGVALAAVFALTAVGASTASAAEFHCEVEPCIITGTNAAHNNHVFKASGAEIICTTATFTGTVATKTATSMSVRPTYSGCTFFGEPASVTTTGCTYVFVSHTNVTKHLPANIECTGTSKIIVSSPGCTISFATQNTTQGITATNLAGPPKDVTVHATVKAVFVKEGGSLCFLISGNTGEYTGTATVRGYEDKGIHGNLHENGYVVTEGAQKGVWWE